jgi:hypothetical protein
MERLMPPANDNRQPVYVPDMPDPMAWTFSKWFLSLTTLAVIAAGLWVIANCFADLAGVA